MKLFALHRFSNTMIRWSQYLSAVFLFLWSSNLYAQRAIDNEITLIYHNLGYKNQFTEHDFNFLQSLREPDLLQMPDSVIYQYHYLIGSWLEFNNGDLQKRIYHIGKALHLVETRQIFPLGIGIIDIEYLWLCSAMANCFKELGDLDKAILQYERTLVRGERLLDKESNVNLRGTKAECISSLGELYAKKGYKREAVNCFEKAFEISSIDYVTKATDKYFPLWRLAIFYEEEKDYAKSILSWKRLIQFFEEHNASLTEENANSYYFLANTYREAKDIDSAIISYKQAIKTYKYINADFEEIEPSYGNLLCAYAEIGNLEGFKEIKSTLRDYYYSQNKEEKYYYSLWAATTLLSTENAKQFMNELLDNFSKLDISKQVDILKRLAAESLDKEQDNCILYCNKGIELINNEIKGNAPAWLYILYQTRSLAYQKQNNFKSAVNDALCALDYFNKCNDATNTTRQQLLFRIMNLHLENKDYVKVMELEKDLIPLTKDIYGEKSHEYVSTLTMIGISLMYNGKCQKAINTFKELSELIQQIDDEKSINFATNLHNIGRAYMLKGEKQNAIAYLEKAKSLQLNIEGVINNKTNQYLNELGIYE